MPNTIRTGHRDPDQPDRAEHRRGAVYRSRAADRRLTQRYISGVGTVAMTLVLLVPVSLLLFPGWLS